ncbi:DnaJ domain-containing protein [Marinobacter sp. 1Y8]
MHWILGIGLTIGVFLVLQHWANLPADRKRQFITRVMVGGFIAVLLVLLLTGRIHVLVAAVGALIPFLRKLPALLRYLPLMNKAYRHFKGEESASGADGEHKQQRQTASSAMSPREARDVLGVTESATREEIIAAHRRLMQKMHPDRGGNDYLAAKINEAKAVLAPK